METKMAHAKNFPNGKDGVPIKGFFDSDTINTPSMLCIEDVLDSLRWAESIGGAEELIRRTRSNFSVIKDWVEVTPWIDFLASSSTTRSPTSVCLKIVDQWFLALADSSKQAFVDRLCGLLQEERAAFDINGHRDAPPGIRIWAGSTVEKNNIVDLLPWLDWAFAEVKTSCEQRT